MTPPPLSLSFSLPLLEHAIQYMLFQISFYIRETYFTADSWKVFVLLDSIPRSSTFSMKKQIDIFRTWLKQALVNYSSANSVGCSASLLVFCSFVCLLVF